MLDVKDMDLVMSEGLGMRYAFLGAFETAHLNAEGESFRRRWNTILENRSSHNCSSFVIQE